MAPAPITADEAPAPRFGARWFVPELARHRRIWRDVLVASLALHLLALAVPLLTQVVIDKVIAHRTYSTLMVVGVGMTLVILFSALLGWIRQYLVLHTGNRIDAVLGARVFEHLLGLPLAWFGARPTGTLVARLHGVETVREFLTGATLALVLDAPCIVLFLAVMFAYHWQLAAVAAGMLVALVLLSIAVTPFLRARLNEQFLQGARQQAFVTEHLAGIETVKTLQMEHTLATRYRVLLGEYLATAFRTRHLANTYQVVAQSIEQVQGLAILGLGALIVMGDGGFTIGMLVAFQMFATRLAQPALRLVTLYQQFQETSVALRRLADLMDEPAEAVVPVAAEPCPVPLAGMPDGAGISVQDLGFRHSARHPWLYRGISITFAPGQLTVLTGPSGCGKSTFARLLLGFHLPAEGRILIDGIDAANLTAHDRRTRFAVVPQETILFSGTVYDNVALAAPHATPDAVERACIAAGIHSTILALPQGYATALGERGVGLSGGQRQRIAIARALLRRSPVLIFDEATSGLDAIAAESLARTINSLRGQVTILFIAHQLPRSLTVDRVLRFGSPGAAHAHVRPA